MGWPGRANGSCESSFRIIHSLTLEALLIICLARYVSSRLHVYLKPSSDSRICLHATGESLVLPNKQTSLKYPCGMRQVFDCIPQHKPQFKLSLLWIIPFNSLVCGTVLCEVEVDLKEGFLKVPNTESSMSATKVIHSTSVGTPNSWHDGTVYRKSDFSDRFNI